MRLVQEPGVMLNAKNATSSVWHRSLEKEHNTSCAFPSAVHRSLGSVCAQKPAAETAGSAGGSSVLQ